ncbi:transposable element Tcb1 transposase [Trichonephila clavipes]|nr:transposable element Tcb1 transposase [Trichonephila clavipes]
MTNNQSVRRHLDAFTRGRIIGKLEEGRSVTSVATEFGIAHSTVSRLWRQFQTTGTAIRGFSSGRPRGTTPADDRYTLSYRPEETGGRQREKSLDTRHRRLDDRYRVLPWPEDCTVVVCLHDALYDESRFSLSSDSHRILIWRERGSRNHPSNIIERDRYGGRGVLVWGGIMLGSRTDLHIFDAGSVNGTRYCNEILLPYVRLFRGAMGLQSLFMDVNAPCHRTVAAEQLLESEDIEREYEVEIPVLKDAEASLDIGCEKYAAPEMFTGEHASIKHILDDGMTCLQPAERKIECEPGHVVSKPVVSPVHLDKEKYNDQFGLGEYLVGTEENLVPSLTKEDQDTMNLIKINAYEFIETQQKSKELAPLIQKIENGINNEVRDQEIAPTCN